MAKLINRVVPVDGSVNLRELGGIATTDGRHIKTQQVLRSGSMSGITLRGQQQLWDYGVRVVIDFRSLSETQMAPDRLPGEVHYYHDPVYAMTAGDQDTAWQRVKDFFGGGKKTKLEHFHYADGLAGLYQQIILDPFSQHAYSFMFQQLLANTTPGHSVVFHCAAGKDRTGMGAALIEKALGVADDLIVQDYLLTNLVLGGMSEADVTKFLADPHVDSRVTRMNLMQGEAAAMPAIFHAIDTIYGSFAGFWQNALRLKPVQLTALRQRYLE
ncbi:tyrosine-protein phosphatase [Schleiferilactobacillus shenzhenensis]|uniref:Protein-tyrosine phosphatase n=1 Tax=Schleiferilactobacillus shenzhenensis LY-73 TaxID=1231336 RepID=U4TLT5_9LACO|nr:tyrosine-protein phosphatase [Schleiferilactobacillus shenzhenensis]ERL64350.1 protein-tyrosine phosphatase [Schleiferilactobacillus shenzhenensis LY-73]